MADFVTSGFSEIEKQISELGDAVSDVADQMLLEGAAEMVNAWKDSAQRFGHVETGDMINSISYPRQPKTSGGVKTIDISPQGKDRKGVRNAEKAFLLNYGTSSIPATHWVDNAEERGGPAAQAKMEEVFNRKMAEKGLE